jgi:plastocyanin
MHLHLRKFWPALLLLLVATSSWAADHRVTVGGATSSGGYQYPVYMFDPPNVAVNPGDTVTFVNAGGTHNVAADDGSFRCATGCDGAGGNGTPSGTSWTSTVTIGQGQAGSTIHYHCEVHASLGMTGTITVSGTGGGGTGNVPITNAFTGAWYDPNQSGHGIFVEVGPNNTFVAWWFAFSPDGAQAWFGNVGFIDPATNTATVAPIQTEGGRWIPNFNPADVTHPAWGTLRFTFTDCTHGRVDFDSTVPGYGSGHMDLSKLTNIAGLSCP